MNLQDNLNERKQPPGIWNAGGCFFDGVAKSPPYCVTAFFQDLDIPDVCLRP
jgi:hypothetical protein